MFTIWLAWNENVGMKRRAYASDISREKFAEIEPLLRTGCQWRFLPAHFPKWSQPDPDGVSVL